LGHTNNDPNQTLESLERWSARATLFILFGIIVEIGSIFLLPHDVLERIITTVANVLIAIGLIVEYIVILRAIVATGESNRQSDQKVADANARAQEANLKANEAVLELARFRAPRSLFTEQVYRIADKMKEFSPIEFDASINPGDPEFKLCLSFIEWALRLAGWKQQSWDGTGSENRDLLGLPAIGLGGSVSNVAIFFTGEKDSRNEGAARALADALTLEGITSNARTSFKNTELGAAKQYPIHIAVGPKA
jgi:hypothetical protein